MGEAWKLFALPDVAFRPSEGRPGACRSNCLGVRVWGLGFGV